MRALNSLLNECDLHLLALREAMARCPQPLTEDHFTTRNPALVATLDPFAYRFTKLQDVISVQVLTGYSAVPLMDARPHQATT